MPVSEEARVGNITTVRKAMTIRFSKGVATLTTMLLVIFAAALYISQAGVAVDKYERYMTLGAGVGAEELVQDLLKTNGVGTPAVLLADKLEDANFDCSAFRAGNLSCVRDFFWQTGSNKGRSRGLISVRIHQDAVGRILRLECRVSPEAIFL